MNLAINGEQKSFDNIETLQQLLVVLEYVAETDVINGTTFVSNIVVALNQAIVPASRYADTMLNENDQLDILGAITGG
ncbi:sulfur carrier protein ThiS [Bacterioplanoides sp.]|uniref:sulfur carrier protein ThiS n=1 Tax=Bacterioplanoides sp. TaxID=2066072 RepID=UPI003B5B34F1